MSFAILFTVKGEGQELLAGYDTTVAVPYPTRVGHLMAPTNDGMMGVEVWTSRRTSSGTWPTTSPIFSSGRVWWTSSR